MATITSAFGQSEYLTPKEVFDEFRIPVETQNVWRSGNRHGWRDLSIRAGRKILYRRADILSWLEARRGLAT
jgi:hypothetical protein